MRDSEGWMKRGRLKKDRKRGEENRGGGDAFR